MNNKYLNESELYETQKSLHEVSKYVIRMNKIYPRRFGKCYENFLGLKHIVVTIDGKIFDIEKGLLPTNRTQDGYLMVSINGSSYLVHRLVAIAFCVNYNKNDKVVCHKNKIRTDNRACNLMWTNNSYIANRREDGFHKKKENIKRPIKATDDNGYYAIFANANLAMKELGVPRGNIYKVCKGQRLTAGGYKFSYVTNVEII